MIHALLCTNKALNPAWGSCILTQEFFSNLTGSAISADPRHPPPEGCSTACAARRGAMQARCARLVTIERVTAAA